RSDYAPDRRGTAWPVHGRGRALREPLLSRAHVPPAGGRRGPPLGPVLRGRSRRASGVGPYPRDLPQDDRRHGGRALGAALAEPARLAGTPHAPAHVHHGVAAPGSGPEDPYVPGWRAREPGPLRG